MLALCSYLRSAEQRAGPVTGDHFFTLAIARWMSDHSLVGDEVTFCAELQAEHSGVSSGSFNLDETRKLRLCLLQMPHCSKSSLLQNNTVCDFFSFVISPFT